MTDNTPEGLPPLADLSEALARGREPWPVLHSIEDTTQRPPGWWESWPALLLIVAGAALAKC